MAPKKDSKAKPSGKTKDTRSRSTTPVSKAPVLSKAAPEKLLKRPRKTPQEIDQSAVDKPIAVPAGSAKRRAVSQKAKASTPVGTFPPTFLLCPKLHQTTYLS